MTKKAETTAKKYGGKQTLWEARINAENHGNIVKVVLRSVQNIFQTLLENTTKDLTKKDRVRVIIFSAELDRPISTNMCLNSEMNSRKILTAIMKVLQSKENLSIDKSFKIDVLTIKVPEGGLRTKVINIAVDRLKKKSIVQIKNTDNLCCARALIVAVAVLENNPRKASICDSRNALQKDLAIQLHETSAVPLGSCGLQEIAIFEGKLNIQVHVVSSENFNKVRLF